LVIESHSHSYQKYLFGVLSDSYTGYLGSYLQIADIQDSYLGSYLQIADIQDSYLGSYLQIADIQDISEIAI
jgi:hypothetical protein